MEAACAKVGERAVCRGENAQTMARRWLPAQRGINAPCSVWEIGCTLGWEEMYLQLHR